MNELGECCYSIWNDGNSIWNDANREAVAALVVINLSVRNLVNDQFYYPVRSSTWDDIAIGIKQSIKDELRRSNG